METEKLYNLLQKLKRNKEKVPISVLKTRYKTSYEKLIAEIEAEAIEAVMIPTAVALPKWIEGQKVRADHILKIGEIFDQIYREGEYSKKIGKALMEHYSIEEVQELSKEINKKFHDELSNYFCQNICLYTTAENWDPDSELIPRIYNDLVDKFWDEEKGWISQDRPSGNALLIFIGDPSIEKEMGK